MTFMRLIIIHSSSSSSYSSFSSSSSSSHVALSNSTHKERFRVRYLYYLPSFILRQKKQHAATATPHTSLQLYITPQIVSPMSTILLSQSITSLDSPSAVYSLPQARVPQEYILDPITHHRQPHHRSSLMCYYAQQNERPARLSNEAISGEDAASTTPNHPRATESPLVAAVRDLQQQALSATMPKSMSTCHVDECHHGVGGGGGVCCWSPKQQAHSLNNNSMAGRLSGSMTHWQYPPPATSPNHHTSEDLGLSPGGTPSRLVRPTLNGSQLAPTAIEERSSIVPRMVDRNGDTAFAVRRFQRVMDDRLRASMSRIAEFENKLQDAHQFMSNAIIAPVIRNETPTATMMMVMSTQCDSAAAVAAAAAKKTKTVREPPLRPTLFRSILRYMLHRIVELVFGWWKKSKHFREHAALFLGSTRSASKQAKGVTSVIPLA